MFKGVVKAELISDFVQKFFGFIDKISANLLKLHIRCPKGKNQEKCQVFEIIYSSNDFRTLSNFFSASCQIFLAGVISTLPGEHFGDLHF